MWAISGCSVSFDTLVWRCWAQEHGNVLWNVKCPTCRFSEGESFSWMAWTFVSHEDFFHPPKKFSKCADVHVGLHGCGVKDHVSKHSLNPPFNRRTSKNICALVDVSGFWGRQSLLLGLWSLGVVHWKTENTTRSKLSCKSTNNSFFFFFLPSFISFIVKKKTTKKKKKKSSSHAWETSRSFSFGVTFVHGTAHPVSACETFALESDARNEGLTPATFLAPWLSSIEFRPQGKIILEQNVLRARGTKSSHHVFPVAKIHRCVVSSDEIAQSLAQSRFQILRRAHQLQARIAQIIYHVLTDFICGLTPAEKKR